jgi:hypothetical protein
VRAGSYSAQHLTEGIVPGAVAQLYGTAPQAAKLVKVGLWHASQHDCPRCPQPAAGDYVIHDFFEGGRNTTRAQDEANRRSAAERAAKSRAARNANQNASETASNRPRFEEQNSANRDRNEPHFSGSAAGQEGLSHRTPADSVTHAPTPTPSPFSPYGENGAPPTTERERAHGLPDQLVDLKRAIAAAGISGIDWQLRESQWEYTRQAVARVGIPAMVVYAVNSCRLKGTPSGASAWVNGWRSLEAPPDNGVTYLPAVVGQPQPMSRTDQKFAAGLAFADRLAAEDQNR